MGFQHGLSGLSAASTNLDVIGNNVANVNTAGFKQSQAQFTDIFANSLSGSGSSQVGIGARVSTIAQSFTQGNISPTSNPLDIAINGQGFYRMDEGGVISYSRNGQFHVEGNGFLTNANGANLTGYTADANGNIDASKPPAASPASGPIHLLMPEGAAAAGAAAPAGATVFCAGAFGASF